MSVAAQPRRTILVRAGAAIAPEASYVMWSTTDAWLQADLHGLDRERRRKARSAIRERARELGFHVRIPDDQADLALIAALREPEVRSRAGLVIERDSPVPPTLYDASSDTLADELAHRAQVIGRIREREDAELREELAMRERRLREIDKWTRDRDPGAGFTGRNPTRDGIRERSATSPRPRRSLTPLAPSIRKSRVLPADVVAGSELARDIYRFVPRSADRQRQLWLSQRALDAISRAVRDDPENETAGILVGHKAWSYKPIRVSDAVVFESLESGPGYASFRHDEPWRHDVRSRDHDAGRVVGFFHSHPRRDGESLHDRLLTEPSANDISVAAEAADDMNRRQRLTGGFASLIVAADAYGHWSDPLVMRGLLVSRSDFDGTPMFEDMLLELPQ